MVYVPPDILASWPHRDRVNPETRGPELLIVSSIFLCLATGAVIGRLYARLFIRRWVGLDDMLIVFAWVCWHALSNMERLKG